MEESDDKMDNSITVIIHNMNVLEQRRNSNAEMMLERSRTNSFVRDGEVKEEDDEDDGVVGLFVSDVLSSDVKTMQVFSLFLLLFVCD
jgi:hypothetical protein